MGWLNEIGVYGFLLFATFLWLFLSPLSIYLLEEKIQNKRFLLVLAGAGVIFGIYLFGWIIYHGVEPQTFSGNLFYDLKFIPFYEMSKYLYLTIIVLPFLIAQRLSFKLFGGLIIGSFVISQLFFQVTLVSVWCFFAAILSGVLYCLLKT